MNTEQTHSVVIVGLPGSGKTTFLAALWHSVTTRDIPLELQFSSLGKGDKSHLNSIADRWARAEVQERTKVGTARLVSMNLCTSQNNNINLTFPDVSGETFRRMWEEREIEPEFASIVDTGNVLLFIHSDKISRPRWTVEAADLAQAIGAELPEGEETPWGPEYAPTQVKLVGLLQLLRMQPLDSGPRRVAIILSAWDKGEDEHLGPEDFLEQELPLLHQYLHHGSDTGEWRVYGVSAQGGDYDDPQSTDVTSEEAEKLRALRIASERIRLVDGTNETHDLTVPIAWIIE